MSNCVILQKIIYRLPGTKRPVFGLLLAQNEDGISLCFIKRPNGAHSHVICVAVDSGKGYYEEAKSSNFGLDNAAVATTIGLKLQAIAGGLEEVDIDKILEDLI